MEAPPLAWAPLGGHLQRGARFCLAGHDGQATTSQIAEWCQPEIVYAGGKPTAIQIAKHARALRSIGARKVDVTTIQQRQKIAIQVRLRRLTDLVHDVAAPHKQLARKFAGIVIARDLGDVVAFQQRAHVLDHRARREIRPELAVDDQVLAALCPIASVKESSPEPEAGSQNAL
jgi:hypothetical protein